MASACHRLLPLLLLFSTALAASQVLGPVFDAAGKPVLRGVPYIVTSPDFPFGNALGATSSDPPTVRLDTGLSGGLPLILVPEGNPEEDNVLIAQHLNVAFVFPVLPPLNPGQWTFDTKTKLVTLNASPSSSSVNFNLFWVAPHKNSGARYFYELWSCPSPSIRCAKLGLIGEERLLGESDTPLAVQFNRLESATGLRSTA